MSDAKETVSCIFPAIPGITNISEKISDAMYMYSLHIVHKVTYSNTNANKIILAKKNPETIDHLNMRPYKSMY